MVGDDEGPGRARAFFRICPGRQTGVNARAARHPHPLHDKGPTLRLRALALALVAGAGPLPLLAQTIPSAFERIEHSQEAGPFVGSFRGSEGSVGFGPGPGLITGGRYAVELGGPFSFEGVAGFLFGARDVIDPERPEGNRITGESDVQMLLVEARIKFALTGRRTWHRISPHLIFGGGVAHDFAGLQVDDERILEDDRFTFGTAFMATTGGGIRLFLSDRLSARAEALVHIWQLDTPDGYAEVGRGFEGIEESEWVNGLGLMVGLAYRF